MLTIGSSGSPINMAPAEPSRCAHGRMEIKIKSADELNKLLDALALEIVDANIYYRLYSVKDHVNSPPLESPHFPTFGRERLDDFGLNFFRYDSPSMTK
jgi:hypothetical protein